jgi:fructokinase
MASHTPRHNGRVASPSILTSGYFALDTIVENEVLGFSAGGTAGNVAAALGFLEWSAAVAGVVGDDKPGERLRRDLRGAGVATNYLVTGQPGQTPQVIHMLNRGRPRYLFQCSGCGRPFPKSQTLPEDRVTRILANKDALDVFFFDRATRFTVALAEAFSELGALIVFEPSTRGRSQLVQRARTVADVVKLSLDSPGADLSLLKPTHDQQVIIITEGTLGARVKLGRGKWRRGRALDAPAFVDSAGAGDWTTAGFLHALMTRADSEHLSENDVFDALRLGQAVAALSCGWRGARGLSRNRRPADVIADASSLLYGDELATPAKEREYRFRVSEDQCLLCLTPLRPKKLRTKRSP